MRRKGCLCFSPSVYLVIFVLSPGFLHRLVDAPLNSATVKQIVRVVLRIATVLLLVLTLGWHWGVLQTVAWTGMVAAYSRDASLSEAISKTLDGKHPCPLCTAIAQGKKSEKKAEFTTLIKKLDFSYSQTVFVFSAPTAFWLLPTPNAASRSTDFSPPTPPPRQCQA